VKQPTVLVVDDDAELRLAVGTVLAQAGYHVIEAPDGVVGLEKARAARPFLILLDVTMPRLGGWAFLSLRLADAGLAGTPIILMTGDHETAKLRTVAGPVGILGKPFSFAELLGEIVRWHPQETTL
jgi:CheY-like chemotaxis protein